MRAKFRRYNLLITHRSVCLLIGSTAQRAFGKYHIPTKFVNVYDRSSRPITPLIVRKAKNFLLTSRNENNLYILEMS